MLVREVSQHWLDYFNLVWNNSIGLHNKQESYVICFETKLVKERAYKIIYNIVTQQEGLSKKITGNAVFCLSLVCFLIQRMTKVLIGYKSKKLLIQ
jgi:hypothetical protein